MEKNFESLGVIEEIVSSIKEMGFEHPTEVQREAIPLILQRKDLIVMSKTGSGKTGAFGMPLIQLVDKEMNKPQGLILTPTRELAVQVNQEVQKMSKALSLKTTAVYGQHNINVEIKELKSGAAIICGTPGRVYDHISSNNFDTRNIKFLVLDEADRMLDMGFYDQVVQIIKKVPKDRVTLLFSATMPSEIKRICKSHMNEPMTLELGSDTKTVDTIKQIYYRVKQDEKRKQLNKILKVEEPDSCIIFCNTRSEVDKVERYYKQKGYAVAALHGGNTQTSRMKTIDLIKNKKRQLIIATDVAARGIHIDDLSLVVNYDVPLDKDSYVHRIGRTGRVGHSGKAITLVTSNNLWDFYAVEEHVGVIIEEAQLPTDEMVKEAERSSESKWTKHRIENKDKVVMNKGSKSHNQKKNKGTDHHKKNSNKETDRYYQKNHNVGKNNVQSKNENSKYNDKKNGLQDNKHSQQNSFKNEKASSSPVKINTKTKVIDYKLEAEKLLKKANVKSNPTLLDRIKNLFVKSNK